MYCKNCGARNPNDATFCMECGAGTNNEPQSMRQSQQSLNMSPQNNHEKNKGFIIIAIVVAVLVIALAICVGLLIGKSGNDGEAKATGNEAIEVTPTPEETKVVATTEPTKEPTAEPTKEPTQEPTKEPVQESQQQAQVQQDTPEIEMAIRPSDPSNGEPMEILQIREWFQDTENNAQKSSQHGGVTCYRKNGELVKIRVDAGYVVGVYDGFLTGNRREYFYRNGELYFVNIITAKPAGDRFYYVNGDVIRYSEPHDKKHYYNEQLSPHMGLGYSCKNEGEALFWENY